MRLTARRANVALPRSANDFGDAEMFELQTKGRQ